MPIALSVASGLLISSAYPPYHYDLVPWFGLAPFLYALRRTNLLAGAVLSLLAGIVFNISIFYWAGSIVEIGVANWLLFMVVPQSLYFLFFGIFYRRISRTIGSWIIIGAPALWIALEYARSNLFFLALPWNLLAHSQYRNLPVIQIADVTGVYGISFLVVMVNQLVSQLPDSDIFRRWQSSADAVSQTNTTNWTAQIVTVVFCLLVVLSYGWYRQSESTATKHLRVAMVQANLLARDNMPHAEQLAHLNGYGQLTLSAAGEKPGLIVWPASSLPAALKTSRLVRHMVVQLARETGVPLLVGGSGNEKMGANGNETPAYSNSEFLILPSGRLNGQYNKMRLLPFNEYVPLKGTVQWPEMIAAVRKDFMPGESYTIFQVSEARFGAPICWENLFSDHFRRFVKAGANFMVSATNEGFFGPTPAPYQTLAINIFRAVENRVAIARAATTGVSAFIDPNGKIFERVLDSSGKDLFVSGFIVRDVPLSDKKTFYTLYGDVFAYVAIGITLLSVLYSICIFKANTSSKHRL